MNAPTPCRVSADLRQYEAAQQREFSDAELIEARDEIVSAILNGHTCHGFDLNACLDCEFNSDGYTGTVNDLCGLIRGLDGEEGMSRADSYCTTHHAVLDLAERIVAKHIPESAIADRAAQIRLDREEAAHAD